MHPLFVRVVEELLQEAKKIKVTQPDAFDSHPKVKLLAKIINLISDEIPQDPSHTKFNQGNTLGSNHRAWKRAKFGRYRLFFRYHSKIQKDDVELKVIVFVWLNDEKGLRKEGDKNDPYAVFERMLKAGNPPSSFEELVQESVNLDLLDKLQEISKQYPE